MSRPWPHDQALHAWWVAPGRVLAGEYPGERSEARTAEYPAPCIDACTGDMPPSLDTSRAREKLELLADAGIDTIVDLTHPDDGLASYANAWAALGAERGLDLRRRHHPIPDLGVVDQRGYGAIVTDIERELTAGRNVYVHCWGGVGRTGTVIGAWLRNRGFTAAEALETIRRARAGTRKARRPAPETEAQVAAIRRFVSWRDTVSSHALGNVRKEVA